MNVTITRQNLHKGLAAVSASIPSKTTLPVLSNILFEVGQDGIWMSGTDLDVAVRVWVPAEVRDQGSITAPGKKIQEIPHGVTSVPIEKGEQSSWGLMRSDQLEKLVKKANVAGAR